MTAVAPAGEDYGVLTDVVTNVGTAFAALLAIVLAWRGRTQWEPSEEDVSRGPQKVGGVLALAGLVLLRFTYSDDGETGALPWLLVLFALLCLVGLLLYSYLIARQTYYLERVNGSAVEKVTVIGGFRTTERARELTSQGKTVQELLKGTAYEVDRVWPRESRAAAKLSFVAAYLLLTVSGTLAVVCAALLLGHTS